MRFLKSILLLVSVLFCAAPALAQPTITNITPGYGGVGPHAVGVTITGTGFSTTPKATRFVNNQNSDVLIGVSCESTTTCTASGSRPNLVPAGSVLTLQVFAMVNGVKSVGSTGFLYYGALVITGLTPSTGPYGSATSGSVSGGPFSDSPGFPGTSSVYIYTFIADYTSGCTSTAQCAFTMPNIAGDLSAPQGAYSMAIGTPGGYATAYFLVGTTPATPTITSVSPLTGPAAGGNTLTVTGTGFRQVPGATTTFVISVPGAGVSSTVGPMTCASNTTCTFAAPAGGPGGLADFQVFTSCPSGTACAGTRASGSIPSTKTGAYSYSGLKISPGFGTTLYTSETGQSASFTVELRTQPSANVHVALTLNPAGRATLSAPGGLDFTPSNWNTPQTVTVTGLDVAGTGNNGFSVSSMATSADLNYNNINGNDQQFVNLDNESKNFYVSPQSGLITTRAGGTATFTVMLTQAPTGTVTINLASNDVSLGTVSPSSLTFSTSSGGGTGWDVPRTVTITGQNDSAPGESRAYSILITSTSSDATYGNPNMLYPPDVQVTNVDPPPASSSAAPGDFNGDGTTDIAVFRPSTGQWIVRNGSTVQWGVPGDILVPGDFNGDGTTDRAAYRPSTGVWFVQGQAQVQWGIPGDIPVPGDYNGDGTTDRAVYRPSNGTWQVQGQGQVAWGIPGDVPVPGDYNGDGTTDRAVYRTSNGTWQVQGQAQVAWGIPGDMPVPGDYNGDGTTDRAVYRPSIGTWFVQSQSAAQWGVSGDVPVPGDYDGNGTIDRAVFRPSTGTWFVQSQPAVQWGVAGDLPVLRPEVVGDLNWDGTTDVAGYLADFDGNGTTDVAVYRPSTGTWYPKDQSASQFGLDGDILVPGDYTGDGLADRAVYRPSTGTWFVQNGSTVNWGLAGDIPVPGDYDGNGTTDRAVYSPSTGIWWVQNQGPVQWGIQGDVPAPGDYNGDGTTDIAVYRPSAGTWFVVGQGAMTWGLPGDIAVPGDYDGNGTTDRAVYTPSTGVWWVQGQGPVLWGAAGDLVVPGDYDGNGTTDRAVYRPSTGTWFVKDQFTVQWGLPSDIPASRAYVPR